MNAVVNTSEAAQRALREMTEMVCGLARAQTDENPRAMRDYVQRTAVGYSGTAGGFLLKPEMAATIIDHSRMRDGPFARCNWVPTQNRTFWLPIFNETSRQNKKRWGGIQANVGQSENLSMTGSGPTIGRVNLNMNRMDVFIPDISRNLLADTNLLTRILNYCARSELRFQIDASLITGSNPNSNTGGIPATCPRGVMNTAAGVKVTRQTGSTITQQDIDKMWAAIAEACSQTMVWHATKNTIDNLDSISQSATSFWPENVYIPSGRYGNTYSTLKNRPLIPNENCSQIGTPGDLIASCWEDYWLAYHVMDDGTTERETATKGAKDGGLAFKVMPSSAGGQSGWGAWGLPEDSVESRMSDQFSFLADTVAFLFKLRCDGDFCWAGPEVDVNGQTVGPCAWLS